MKNVYLISLYILNKIPSVLKITMVIEILAVQVIVRCRVKCEI